jgi:hypothetical protein
LIGQWFFTTIWWYVFKHISDAHNGTIGKSNNDVTTVFGPNNTAATSHGSGANNRTITDSAASTALDASQNAYVVTYSLDPTSFTNGAIGGVDLLLLLLVLLQHIQTRYHPPMYFQSWCKPQEEGLRKKEGHLWPLVELCWNFMILGNFIFCRLGRYQHWLAMSTPTQKNEKYTLVRALDLVDFVCGRVKSVGLLFV